MNKDLIELQKGLKATCVIVPTHECTELSQTLAMSANVSDKFLFAGENPPFAEKIENKSKKGKICYFVITGIDEVAFEKQNRFVGLVKDREFNGYNLPNNCVIVFTVKDRDSLKKVSQEIYRFAVVAF